MCNIRLWYLACVAKRILVCVVLYYNIWSNSSETSEKCDWNRQQDVIITRWVRLARTPGGWYRGRAPSYLQNCIIRDCSLSVHIVFNVFFRSIPRAPNCAAHDVKWTFRHGRVPPAALVHNIVGIYYYGSFGLCTQTHLVATNVWSV